MNWANIGKIRQLGKQRRSSSNRQAWKNEPAREWQNNSMSSEKVCTSQNDKWILSKYTNFRVNCQTHSISPSRNWLESVRRRPSSWQNKMGRARCKEGRACGRTRWAELDVKKAKLTGQDWPSSTWRGPSSWQDKMDRARCEEDRARDRTRWTELDVKRAQDYHRKDHDKIRWAEFKINPRWWA